MTKEQLARFGVVIEQDEIADEEAYKLIEQAVSGLNAEKTKLKGQVDKYSHEVSEYKKKETEKLSEDEKTKLHYEELEKENVNLKKQMNISSRENAYIGMGYDPKLAHEIAEAEVEGKPTAELHNKHMTALKEKVKAEILKDSPRPETDNNSKTWTKEEFAKAPYEEKLKIHNENPTLYAELTK